jgi:glycosyltransferase involved in cell wall biosynthesis
MWPSDHLPVSGLYVKEQVEAIRALAPWIHIDVLAIEGTTSRLEYPRAISRLRRALDRGYDLIHAHYGLTAAVAVTQSSCPVIATYHGSDVYVGWQRSVSRFAARRTDANIFVSDRLRRKMGRGDGEIIPCGVNLRYFAPRDRSEARNRLGWKPDRRYVLFPGHPGNPVKNYTLFEQTLAALPPALRQKTDPVLLTGVPRESVPVYLAAVDTVLITSRYEGACNVAKEALACGRPVVSPAVGDVPEMVSGIAGCAIVPPEPESLAKALLNAFEEGAGDGGPERVRLLQADSVSVANRVLSLYRSVERDHAMDVGPDGATGSAGRERAGASQ